MSSENKKWTGYSVRGIGAPSVLVAVFWFAIWLVWPVNGFVVEENRVESNCRVMSVPVMKGYAGINPTDIVRASRNRRSLSTLSGALMRYYSGRPAYVEENWRTADKGSREEEIVHETSETYGFVPVWTDKPVFDGKPEQPGGLLFEATGKLGEYEFSLAPAVLDGLREGEAPWQIELSVAVNARGRVEHVFVEESTSDTARDSRIVRAVYNGRVPGDHAGCRGRLVICFAGEKAREAK